MFHLIIVSLLPGQSERAGHVYCPQSPGLLHTYVYESGHRLRGGWTLGRTTLAFGLHAAAHSEWQYRELMDY
jgi:hypothetical protein